MYNHIVHKFVKVIDLHELIQLSGLMSWIMLDIILKLYLKISLTKY